MDDRFLPDPADYPGLDYSSDLRQPNQQGRNHPPSWLEQIIESAPFAGAVQLERFAENLKDCRTSCAVAVPVRDEVRLLPRCLSGLLSSGEQIDHSPAYVFVVHDTSDRSYEIICDWLFKNDLPGTVVDLRLAARIRNAPHARRFALDIAVRLCPSGTLFTTDADSCVGTRWWRQCLIHIDRGCDLVCEDVELFDEELAQLPVQVRLIGDAEREYFELSDRLWTQWTNGACGRFAHRASGASMAFRSTIYTQLGGLPLPSVGEDSALCTAMVDAGYKVVSLPNFGTRTSARICARARGGCGAALSERSCMDDPFCDTRLLPVAELRRFASATFAATYGSALHTGSSQARGVRPCRPLRYSEVLIELEQGRALLGNGTRRRAG